MRNSDSQLSNNDLIKSKFKIYLMAFNAGLGSFFFGYNQSVWNTSKN